MSSLDPSLPGALESSDSLSSLSSPSILANKPIPANLQRSSARLQFPPSYVVIGVYRLFTDERLYKPVWDKCRHGVKRGLTVGVVWAGMTFHIQRKFVELFMMKSPRVTGLTDTSIFGIPIPFNLPTYRAWDQTLLSRGKQPDFWKPYVEEWENPPQAKPSRALSVAGLMSSFAGRWVVKLALSPLHLVPVFGMMTSAYLKALGTAKHLHLPYYKAKGMSQDQIAIFIEERKWGYRAFGFTAAFLEGLPFVGLIFTVSNRVGACMWAHDLEKRQHYAAELRAGVGAKKH
ncbi:hypothetical protein EIP91_001292 [Steccherinum ochraceum]|uniref:Uncharacterized protein n=1 Tax=Steccherinum ochraceum TaxID=92696 RepID=A0A4R0RGS7_9APHY|nr:hypothetical protein EIP91_001292 [Steccherinum ochraceum]